MSVAFELEVRRSIRATALALLCASVAASGLLLCAASLVFGPTFVMQGGNALRFLTATGIGLAGATVLGLTLRSLVVQRSAARSIRLSVDDSGSLVCGDALNGPAVASALRSVCRLPGLIVLALAPSAVNRGPNSPVITLMLGRDAMTAESWRRLNVWLLWQLRGQTVQQSTGTIPQ